MEVSASKADKARKDGGLIPQVTPSFLAGFMD
jgi:hypothetical protein